MDETPLEIRLDDDFVQIIQLVIIRAVIRWVI